MGISVKDITTGRKTFFITPDSSLIPPNYLEDFFALGYECYFVEYDVRIPLEKKIDIILSLFHDVILFFNVDFNIPDISWPVFISKIIEKYNNKVNIGVMYAKRQIKEDRARLEQKYLYEMGLNCGCIQLEYQKRHNFEIIETILYANQAQGKRRNIRAMCTNACTYLCNYKDEKLNGRLQDISLSHFTILIPVSEDKIALYEKVENIRINLKGISFHSDAVLIMKREYKDNILCVFAFVSPEGTSGLEQSAKHLLMQSIHNLMVSNCNNLIEQIYSKAENVGSFDEIDEVDEVV